MLNLFLVYFGKIISKLFKILNLGDGSTWPGHIALIVNKKFISQLLKESQTKVIIIAGTNGKTTTSSLITILLKSNGKTAMQNLSGANLLNGIASTLILNSNINGGLDADFAVFEIDENALPNILKELTPKFVILLNLFRDQLDRYGEVNIIASNWRNAIHELSENTTLILNADDPQIAYFAKNTKAKSVFFGLNENSSDNTQASDSDYCPNCGKRLLYLQRVFSHLGKWVCKRCGLKRPTLDIDSSTFYPLPGTYNKYNTLASILLLKELGISEIQTEKAFSGFQPAFGRQENIKYKNKNVQIFLSKNPTSFNQSFKTITELKAKTLLIILNDRIPDGKDVSWIWDTDLQKIDTYKHVLIAGDRVYDMGLRIQYELGMDKYKQIAKTYENVEDAILSGVNITANNETLYILPTYSAMLDSRKILTGKKIL